MPTTIGISDRDLRLILDVVDRSRCGQAGEHVPDSLLRDLGHLIAYDDATFQVMDPYRRSLSVQSASPEGSGDAEDAAVDDLWWAAFWESCSDPVRSGDYASVVRGTDPLPYAHEGPAWNAYAEAVPEAAAHHVVVSLPPQGPTDRRLILWRDDGPDFSDRDVQLLTLLRPHLIDVYDRHQEERAGAPQLTLRQWEILRLVASGLTNGQIARRLSVSEATVRKHLENTYARLDVTNRTAAVDRTRRYLLAG
jgi:DNA-binding CsgD family transcriptional regulator